VYKGTTIAIAFSLTLHLAVVVLMSLLLWAMDTLFGWAISSVIG